MAEKNKEVSEIFDNGLDRKNRRIYWGMLSDDDGDIFMWKTVEQAIRAMHILVNDNPKKPIELHMHSPGGGANAMLRLVDEIKACPCQIKFFGGGAISSSATWVMAICDERNLHVNTELVFHDGSDALDGKHTDVQIEARATKDLQNNLDRIFAENSRMPETFWNDVLQRDVYLTADEAVKFGLADNIIEPKKRGNLRRSRIAKMSKEIDAKEIKQLVKSIYKRIDRKTITKIEISLPPVEECDPNVIIDNSEDTNDRYVQDSQGQNSGESTQGNKAQ